MKFLILVVLVMFCSRISSFRTGFYDKVYVYSAFKKFDPAPKFEVFGPAFLNVLYKPERFRKHVRPVGYRIRPSKRAFGMDDFDDDTFDKFFEKRHGAPNNPEYGDYRDFWP